ncbi:hypothetical protein BGX28_007603 [Mortierella sp. GBA30]|nr:hypothetical protein BGX28_007603 [Mortierella sp. GBA30]
MRIFLIPLSRTAKALHCHSTLAPSSTSYLNRVTTWAGKKWEGLSRAPPDSIKTKLYGAGSRMLEKLEHKETFFKEVPSKEDATITDMVPFMYPSALKEAQVSAEFRALLEQRIPYHRKYMIYSALWVPVTSLFIIVPLVPNIPLFYNAFRLWSHWKEYLWTAYNGAKHLDLMVKSGMVSFQPSDVLNLGLQHDPDFAVFFTGSHHLSKKRGARRRHSEQDQKGPVITESSGEITPTLSLNNNAGSTAASTTGSGDAKARSLALTKLEDPMSVTDHVVHEGFITDAEIQTICIAFERPPMMGREIKRARYQEAEKYVKQRLMEDKSKKNHRQKQT